MTSDTGWTADHYRLFRGLFGGYLFVHFVHLLPWGTELFSSQGMVGIAADSPLVFLFPNILGVLDSPAFVTLFLLSGAAAAVCFAAGVRDKWAALWCWYVLACLFGGNPLIQNPSLPYVGWMLLAHLAIPATTAAGWRMPRHVYAAGWVVLALSYSYSGWTKLMSASWRDGSMLGYVLQNPLARDSALREFILSLPPGLLQGITFAILWIEFLFVFLALSRRLRPWAWGAMLIVQFGFAFLLDFADLTFAMLLFHLFTFDPAWVAPAREPEQEEIALGSGSAA
ncbi:MAG TPA: hypothetical protein VM074_12000 [Solimonas sp.]|nr:hypothetical protein [Solimonas sp.]